MANNKNLAEDSKGTQFSSDNQPGNSGRKKRLYSKLKDNGLSHEDIKALFKLMLSLDMEELKAMAKTGRVPPDLKDQFETKLPVVVQIIAVALSGDTQKKNLQNLETMLCRMYGAPKKEIDIAGDFQITQTIIKMEGKEIDE